MSPTLISAAPGPSWPIDRKSTRLNSSHSQISYAVFCLKNTHRSDGAGQGIVEETVEADADRLRVHICETAHAQQHLDDHRRAVRGDALEAAARMLHAVH